MFEEEGTARTKLLVHLGFNVPEEGTQNASDDLSKSFAETLSLNNGTFADGAGDQFAVDNGEEFFNNPPSSDDSFLTEEKDSNNGRQFKKEPEEHPVTSDPSIDDSIQRALVIGDYKGAVMQCIAANRMADALVIAHVGGTALWEITRNQYLRNSISPYLKVCCFTPDFLFNVIFQSFLQVG